MSFLKRYVLYACLLLAFPGVLQAQQPELVSPIGHTASVKTARFSSSEKYLITGGADKSAIIWETLSGKKLHSFPATKTEIGYAFFSMNDKYIVVGTDSSVVIWSVPDYTKMGEFNLTRRTFFSPDSRKVFLEGFNGTIKQLSLPLLKVEHEYTDSMQYSPDRDGRITRTTISADSRLLCSSSQSFIAVHEIQTGKLLFRKKLAGRPENCHFSGDAQFLLVATDSGMIRFDIKNKFASTIINTEPVEWNFHSKNGRYMLSGTDMAGFGSITLWDLEKLKPITGLSSMSSIRDTILMKSINGNDTFLTGTAPYRFPSFQVASGWLGVDISDDGRYLRVYDLLWNVFHDEKTALITDNVLRRSDISSDNKYILTQQQDGIIGLWSIVENKQVQTYQTRADNIRIATISPDGKKFLVSGENNMVKIVETATGHTLHVIRGHRDKIFSASFNNDGTRVITNSYDSTAKLWDASTGQLLKDFPKQYPETNPAYFSATGQPVLPKPIIDSVFVFDINGENPRDTGIIRILSNPENFLNQKSQTGRYELRKLTDGTHYLDDHDGPNSAVLDIDYSSNVFSPDDKWIAFADYETDTLFVWDIDMSKWLFKGSLGITAKDYTGARGFEQVLFTPGNKYLLAVDVNAVIHGLSTSDFREIFSLPGERCTVSADGSRLLTVNQGHCDIYELVKQKLLYSYISVDTSNYLAIDAQKRFDGTEKARKMLYYTCGNEIIDLDQVKDLSWEPGLVEKIMGADPEPIKARKLSEINICGNSALIELKKQSPKQYVYGITRRNGGIGEVSILINNKEVKTLSSGELSFTNDSATVSVNLDEFRDYLEPGAENTVNVVARTADQSMTSRGFTVTVKPDKAFAGAPDLYGIIIGVSDFKEPKLNLKFAAKDASDFSKALELSAKQLLDIDGKEHVFIQTLVTGGRQGALPVKQDIQNAFAQVALKAKANDILVVYLSGHGLNYGTEAVNFYYLTADASSFDLAGVEKLNAISTKEFADLLRKIPARKQVMILDACSSGKLAEDIGIALRSGIPSDQVRALDRLNSRTGTFILCGAAANQSAYETSVYGQGLLTYSLLFGMKSGTALQNDAYVDVDALFQFSADEVMKLAKGIGGIQEPVISKPLGGASFAIGKLDVANRNKIELALPRPIFTNSNFQNEKLFKDNIGMAQLIDKALNEVTEKGKSSEFIFADRSQLPGSYSLNGRYTITNTDLMITATLFKGDTPVQTFTVNGKTDNKEEVARELVDKVRMVVK